MNMSHVNEAGLHHGVESHVAAPKVLPDPAESFRGRLHPEHFMANGSSGVIGISSGTWLGVRKEAVNGEISSWGYSCGKRKAEMSRR